MKDNTPSVCELLKKIHDTYVHLTGYEVRYQAQERMYFDLHEAGYTQEDLALVIQHICRQNRHMEWKRSLRIGPLIGDLQRFDETLAEARAYARNRREKTNRQKVLEQWRRVEPSERADHGRVVTLKQALISAMNQQDTPQQRAQ